MNKQGFVIAKNKGVDAFFTSQSSYDRPKWVAVTESKVYATVELAETAAKKLYRYGAYEARIVPLAEAMAFEMPDEDLDDETNVASVPEDDDKTEMVAIVRGEDGVDIPQGDETADIEGMVDADLGIADDVDKQAITTTIDAEMDLGDEDLDLELDDEDEVGLPNGDQVAGGPDGAPITRMESAIVNELSLDTVKSYANKSGRSIAQLRAKADRGDVASDRKRQQRKQGNVRAINRIFSNSQYNESETMPAKPPLDAKPSENKDTALDTKKAEVIKYKDQAVDFNDTDTKLDKSGAWPHDAKVKTPANVLSDLRKAIEDHKKSAKESERSNTERASFCLTVANAFEQLLADLEQGTGEGVKAAQIHMTSWMNPITAYLPQSVQQYVYLGGRKPSLKDFYTKAQKAGE